MSPVSKPQKVPVKKEETGSNVEQPSEAQSNFHQILSSNTMTRDTQDVVASLAENHVITSDTNRNGIVNPLENDCNTGTSRPNQDGRIWFSAVLDDTSTRPVTAPGDVTVSQRERTPDGLPRCSRHHSRRMRRSVVWGVPNPLIDMKGQHGQWTCFLCCHVRTGTILIGFWHMLLHLMTLSMIAVMIIHPEILTQATHNGIQDEQLEVSQGGVQDVQAVNCSEMPCLLATQRDGRLTDSSSEFPLSLGKLMSTHGLSAEDVHVALFITVCTCIVTLLLIYGAIRGQPSHLMPFFFLQVFDFCISSMTMIGYISSLPNIRRVISDDPDFPFQPQLLAMETKCLTFFLMLIFLIIFMVKVYYISIVWRCYKYLMQRSQGGRWANRSRLGQSGPVDQESQTLVLGHDLPDYDTAITDPQYRKKSSSLFPEPPPSYDMAMAAFYAQQQIMAEAQTRRNTTNDNAPLLEVSHSATVGNRETQQEQRAGPSSASTVAMTTVVN